MKKNFLFFIVALCLLAINISTNAQATRTWVSGLGDDVNPCSRTAPCKTLAGAISKTATNGEINILDPAGYGSVTITKSITIDGGGVIGSILSSGTNGIIINAPDGSVTIRNFSINGTGTTMGINGIRVLAVKKLTVENCIIANFGDKGIDINSTTATDVMLSNVTIQNANDGISIGSGGGTIVVNKSQLHGIKNSGITASSGQITIRNSMISGCNTGGEAKTGSTIHLTGNTITNNNTALQGTGKISSAGNNSVTGNKAQGITPTVVKQQ